MKILLVTEKYNPSETQRDGGARMVASLERSFGHKLSIMQFSGGTHQPRNGWNFTYPVDLRDRFERRIANAEFIAKQVGSVVRDFSHIVFVHVSMQFKFFCEDVETWTFPMFLTPSYELSGEKVPGEYMEMERAALLSTKNILTPSYFEKKQLLELYSIPEDKIHVVPRGVDLSILRPIDRSINDARAPVFCSIGSIKPQKNTLGLIRLFSRIKDKYARSFLYVIGPIQNQEYYDLVQSEVKKLKLSDNIRFVGYVAPENLAEYIADAHIHITTSHCETFGRSIFETLASGIPNIVMSQNNAAYDFLQNLPYARFTSNVNESLLAIDDVLSNFSKLSVMSREIGKLYDDKRLANLATAKISSDSTMIICDYDGTFFHKGDQAKTSEYIERFKQFSPRVICSARSTEDLLLQLQSFDVKTDWIISYSGAVITTGEGEILFVTSLSNKEVETIENMFPEHRKIEVNGQIIQIAVSCVLEKEIPEMNIESYQDNSFISNWQSSKLRAICKLLDHVNWQGDVKALGDGKYDLEYLRYFDGRLIQDGGETGVFIDKRMEVKNVEFIL